MQLFYVTIITGGFYMDNITEVKRLREFIRCMERQLGILEESEVSCCKVTLAQCHALVEIGRAKTISLIMLSDLLNLDSSTISRTVNNLVNNKLAERELDKNDRRYITIMLTEKGTTIYEEIEESMNLYYMKVYQSIPVEKQEQVLESIQILLEALSQNDCRR
jgi:DNA-binding MarR family transcriptional regulator